MSICRSCRRPLINAPTHDWLELKCQACGSAFCYSCGEPPHFPAHCPENRRWLMKDIPNHLSLCESNWAYLNCLLGKIEQVQRRYIEDAGYEFFDLFFRDPHLRHAVSEMRSAVELLKWLQVVLCLNPFLEYVANPEYHLVIEKLHKLIASVPLPATPVQIRDLSSEREELGEAVSDILMELFRARQVTDLTPFPHTPPGAVAVPDTAVCQPSPITLPMKVEVPLGFVFLEEAAEGSDKTHLALIYLESFKWEYCYHTRR